MYERKRTKLVHEGDYVAEVDVELLSEPGRLVAVPLP